MSRGQSQSRTYTRTSRPMLDIPSPYLTKSKTPQRRPGNMPIGSLWRLSIVDKIIVRQAGWPIMTPNSGSIAKLDFKHDDHLLCGGKGEVTFHSPASESSNMLSTIVNDMSEMLDKWYSSVKHLKPEIGLRKRG